MSHISCFLFHFNTLTYFLQLFKPKEDKDDSTKIIYQPPKSLLLACQQIVDCLIESLLQLEETSADGEHIKFNIVDLKLHALLHSTTKFVKIKIS